MSLTLKFALTADEFLAGQRVFNKSLARTVERLNYRYAIPVGVLLVAEGLLGCVLRWNIGLCVFLLVFGGYLISSVSFFWPRRMKREFAQYPDHLAEKTVEFDEEKIVTQTSHGKSETDWKRFGRYLETDKLFVLFARPRFLFVVPKRVVPPNELDQFQELLRRKLPNQNPRPKPNSSISH